MESSFLSTSHAPQEWQRGSDEEISRHTVMRKDADSYAHGYAALIERVLRLDCRSEGIDLGAGAGYITAALQRLGYGIKASEYCEEAVQLVRRHNPHLEAVQADISSFRESGRYSLILTREVYAFTRVNAFTEQLQAVSNLLDSLRPGGLLLLIASERTHPHCLDLRLLIRTLRRDTRIARVDGLRHEWIYRHLHALVRGPISAWLMESALAPLLWARNRIFGWPPIYMLAVVKTGGHAR